MRQSPGSVRVQVLLEAEAIGVEAEAVDEIAASTSLVCTMPSSIENLCSFFKEQKCGRKIFIIFVTLSNVNMT